MYCPLIAKIRFHSIIIIIIIYHIHYICLARMILSAFICMPSYTYLES